MQPTSLIIGTTLAESYINFPINEVVDAHLKTSNKNNIPYECIKADPKKESMEVRLQEAQSGRPDWEIQENKSLDLKIQQILLRFVRYSTSQPNEKESSMLVSNCRNS